MYGNELLLLQRIVLTSTGLSPGYGRADIPQALEKDQPLAHPIFLAVRIELRDVLLFNDRWDVIRDVSLEETS